MPRSSNRNKSKDKKNTKKKRKRSKPRLNVIVGGDRVFVLDVFILSGPVTKEHAEKNPEICRTIEIRGDQTLEALHEEIFWAFDREEEHMYEFQVGGKGPQDRKAKEYVLPLAEEPVLPWTPKPAGVVTRTTIGSLGLRVGGHMAYWFDFGDDWWHQIDVIGIEDADDVKYPRVTNRIGESPPQYPNLEDEDYEDDDADEAGPGMVIEAIEQVEYRHGMLEADEKPDGLPIKVWRSEELQPEILEAIGNEGIPDLGGVYGNEMAGDPVQYDHLRLLSADAAVDIVVFNRAIALFTTNDERIVRIHRILCKLDPR